MKVRVPKDLRPPSRTGVFRSPIITDNSFGNFRVVGKFRYPREGEYFWNGAGVVEKAELNFSIFERVILERVK